MLEENQVVWGLWQQAQGIPMLDFSSSNLMFLFICFGNNKVFFVSSESRYLYILLPI